MDNFEAMQIKGILREIKHELSGVMYKVPDMNMVNSLEEIKDHIRKVQYMIVDMTEADENE